MIGARFRMTNPVSAVSTQVQPLIRAFYDPRSCTISYIVADPVSREAAIIDPVLDYVPASASLFTDSVERLLTCMRSERLHLRWILETHVHADHLSGAQALKRELGGQVAGGEGIRGVQLRLSRMFGLAEVDWSRGGGFDRLLADRETLPLGRMEIEVMSTPGHTPACVSYRVEDAVFVGDTLMMPDLGTGRADLPGGDARALYRSIRRLLALSAQTRLFLCHDYGLPGRQPAWETTVAAQRTANTLAAEGIDEEAFIALRQSRDAQLDVPNCILPALQVNIRAGHLPEPGDNGISYLKIPINRLSRGG